MSRLMWIAGILLSAAGLALGVVVLVSSVPAGVSLETAAILLVGGVLSAGLGSVIDGLAALDTGAAVQQRWNGPQSASQPIIPEFGPLGNKTATPAPVPAPAGAAAAAPSPAAIPAEAAHAEVSEPTRETILALEQARLKIERAFDAPDDPLPSLPAQEREDIDDAAAEDEQAREPFDSPSGDGDAEEQRTPFPAAPVVALPAPSGPSEADGEPAAPEEVMEEGQLYVVEERIIRKRPARILSDGTVEAETGEGWMRFENLEHLDEYLDAMEPAKA